LPTEKMRCPFWQCSDPQFKKGHWQIRWTTPEKNATLDLWLWPVPLRFFPLRLSQREINW
jgi:hypothetical protein